MSRDLLDPKARAMLDEMESANRPDASERPIEESRQGLEELFAELGKGPEVEAVEDRTIPGPDGELPARVLRGQGAGPDRPLIVFFHGGGHSQGSIETHDSLCRGLANACRATVLSVDYRLAPEAPFPAAYDDALAAVEWSAEHAGELGADPGTVVVAGDSAGGNLALAVAIARPQLFAAQLLIYPLASFARQRELFDADFDGFFLSYAELEFFQGLYLPAGTDLTDPRVSPLQAESLAGLPPAVVVLGQCDPIHPQGEAVAARLREAGVRAELLVYPGMIHGFYGMTTLFEQAEEAFEGTAAALEAVARPSAEARG
jgi:acetyl esterase